MMDTRIDHTLADDVSAASAAYLFNLLPGFATLPAPDVYERLQHHIFAALVAYAEAAKNWGLPPEPSDSCDTLGLGVDCLK